MADLTTLARVKRSLRLGGPDGATVTNEDAYLNDLIASCTPFCQGKTGRTLVNNATYTRVYDGPGGEALDLQELPINSIATVHEDYERVFSGDTLLVAGTDYYLDSRNGILYRANGLPWNDWAQSIKVVMNVGYTSIPDDLQEAAVKIISLNYQHRTFAGISSRTTEDATLELLGPEDVVKEIKRVLARYSNHRMMVG